jgi:hypothetical protein
MAIGNGWQQMSCTALGYKDWSRLWMHRYQLHHKHLVLPVCVSATVPSPLPTKTSRSFFALV